ncbi:MAG: hypothetical protein Tsb007_30730 [Rhizobacter sp.]
MAPSDVFTLWPVAAVKAALMADKGPAKLAATATDTSPARTFSANTASAARVQVREISFIKV